MRSAGRGGVRAHEMDNVRARMLRLLYPGNQSLALGQRTRSRGQQTRHPSPRHRLQLLRGEPDAFPGQLRDIVPPACPGPSLGPPPGGTCLEHLPREGDGSDKRSLSEPSPRVCLPWETQPEAFKLQTT
ncbi:hypothetical protein AMECASPLE_006172 [Ameca splendens]|uniref:Uncharacterized protein n=1 Tax=Ameca splendens TaxID=208324 RepID=A0ABV0Z829_9TELE